MRWLIVLAAIPVFGGVGSALADIPVTDAAQLTQKSDTASTTVQLVPVTAQRQGANQGVHCAVTTGKRTALANPTVQPLAGAGALAVQTYSPDQPVTPNAAALGVALNTQTLFQSAGNVVGGVAAGQATIISAQSALQSAGQQVGTAPTVMAAFDMNSAARLQSGLAWNGAIAAANLWVTAINALNLAAASDTSSAAVGMRMSMSASPGSSATTCPAGTVSSGEAADPCPPPATCQPTPRANDNACVSARNLGANGDVLIYLTQAQNAAAAASSGR